MAAAGATLASFYERHLAIADGAVLDWTGNGPPARVAVDAVHVAVARNDAYAIDRDGHLVGWSATAAPARLLDAVAHVDAGESSLLAVRTDGSLWQRLAGRTEWRRIADGVTQGCVGDSSDYYLTAGGDLFASGLAHRGQYGDGVLVASDGWRRVAAGVADVCAHTGHALTLGRDGVVYGTGGNRFGPLGSHGFGDKADRWGPLFRDAVRIDTGARHSAALRTDGSLWIWGEHEGLEPRRALESVSDLACGDTETLARTRDGRLWQWATGAEAVSRPAAG